MSSDLDVHAEAMDDLRHELADDDRLDAYLEQLAEFGDDEGEDL